MQEGHHQCKRATINARGPPSIRDCTYTGFPGKPRTFYGVSSNPVFTGFFTGLHAKIPWKTSSGVHNKPRTFSTGFSEQKPRTKPRFYGVFYGVLYGVFYGVYLRTVPDDRRRRRRGDGHRRGTPATSEESEERSKGRREAGLSDNPPPPSPLPPR